MSEFIADALPSLAARGGTHRAADDVGRVRTRSYWRGRPDVFAQDLFRDVLSREHRRAERFDQPFLLVVVRPGPGGRSPSGWGPAVEALIAARRDTDVVGWLETGAALGLILPEIGQADGAIATDIQARVSRELVARRDADAAGAFAVETHLVGVAEAAGAAESLLETVVARQATPVRDALKRALDIAGSLALLALLAPVFLAVAALIKLTSPGPVFFRQTRIGEAGRPFTMLKFRSMRVNADAGIHQAYVSQFIKAGAAAAAGSDAPFKIVNDPRVTRIGGFLRKTSIDEFPQFLNVLRGDMSLVGPRPPLQYEVEQYKPWHRRRLLEAKPGITGLWQVTGRSRTTFDDMVRLDLRYARTYSAWTDIKILLATPKAVISGKGAC